jgi:hypothetical protein
MSLDLELRAKEGGTFRGVYEPGLDQHLRFDRSLADQKFDRVTRRAISYALLQVTRIGNLAEAFTSLRCNRLAGI